MPKPKEEQQPKKEEHLRIFWKNLNILEEEKSSFKPSPSKKESTNKEKKHLQRKTHRKEKSTNKGKVKRKEKHKPRSKNHQDAARSARSLSPSV